MGQMSAKYIIPAGNILHSPVKAYSNNHSVCFYIYITF